ncbi:LacI family DNA-binding transcriptional regulator [Pokkaliibacter plantistimulans]|nr:LacI family DNA-binding transcriptional regulator [Pokkaliibacter plantistimulans]
MVSTADKPDRSPVMKATSGSMTRASATIKTIAAATGFSIATVSRALSGGSPMREATREEILATAKRLGYHQDRAAVRLKTGRTQVIAFVLNREDRLHAFARLMLLGISDGLINSGYHLIVVPEQPGESPLDTVRYLVERRAADGLILTHTQPQDPRVKYLSEVGMPFVTHGRTEMVTPHSYCDFANETFAYQATQALIARGRTRIRVILPPARNTYRGHILDGYSRAMHEAGLPRLIAEGVDLNTLPEQLHAYADTVWQDCDAFFIPEETAALPVISLLQRRGRVIGSDVDIAIKQLTSIGDYLNLPLIRFKENLQQAGGIMAEQILQLIRSSEQPEPLPVLTHLQLPQ